MYCSILLYIINMKIHIMFKYFIMAICSPEIKHIGNMTYLCLKFGEIFNDLNLI